jgi:HEAT repeat protein
VACNLLKTAKNVVSAVNSEIVLVITNLLADDDMLVRIRATQVLGVIVNHRVGRESLFQVHTMRNVADLLGDPEVQVRKNCYKIIAGVCDSLEGIVHLVDVGYVENLVQCSSREIDAIQPLALSSLIRVLKHPDGLATQQALDVGAVESCIELLSSQFARLRSGAAAALTILCFSNDGKLRAIDNNGVESLCTLLTDLDTEVRVNAAGALMGITTEDSAKNIVLDVNGLDSLISLLHDENNQVKINAVKVLGNIVAQPEGRKRLLGDPLARLQELSRDDNALLARSASICVRLVEWKP